MNIYYIRHGETDYNMLRRIQGCIDIPLNDRGKSQAREAGKLIEDVDFDAVFCSPLTRTQQTAKYVLGNRDYSLTLDARLAERNYGVYEGLNYYVLRTTNHDFYRSYTEMEYSSGGIETLSSLVHRVKSFFEELKKEKFENVLVVSHGGIGRVIYAVLKDAPFDEAVRRTIGNCEIIKYEIS